MKNRRVLIPIAIIVGVAIVAAIFIAVIVNSLDGRSIGVEMEEINGQTHTTHYSSTSQAPRSDLPSWFTKSATSITIEVPGPHSVGPGGIQVDASVPNSYV